MAKRQPAEVTWRDGVPVSTQFDDPYFSLSGGLAETRHVFLEGNDLPARFRPGFHIAELGFGTGLNCAAALLSWQEAGIAGPLRFTSFEAFPMAPEDIEAALRPFPEAAAVIAPVLEALSDGPGRVETAALILEIVEGDARSTLPDWPGRADAWFLDGFAPAKNPGLWEPPLMQAVAQHTAPGGSFATYTAAGHVRRALAEAGFEVTRRPGYGRKRHMTHGRLGAAP